MRCSEAKILLDEAIKGIPTLRDHLHDWGRFNAWNRETKIIIARIFRGQTSHIGTFDGIRYSPGAFVAGSGRDHDEERRYWNIGFDEAGAFLKVLKDEVDRDCRFGRYRPASQFP